MALRQAAIVNGSRWVNLRVCLSECHVLTSKQSLISLKLYNFSSLFFRVKPATYASELYEVRVETIREDIENMME